MVQGTTDPVNYILVCYGNQSSSSEEMESTPSVRTAGVDEDSGGDHSDENGSGDEVRGCASGGNSPAVSCSIYS